MEMTNDDGECGGAIFSVGGITLHASEPEKNGVIFSLDDSSSFLDCCGESSLSSSPGGSSLKPSFQKMESITEEYREEYSENSDRLAASCSENSVVELKVVQLLPDFEGTLDDLTLAEPIIYTEEDLCNLQTEIKLDESVVPAEASAVLQETGSDFASFLPPAILQKIVDANDDVESLDPEKAKKAFRPCLVDRKLNASLSLTDEGFIQMKDYKISFDSMGGGRLSEVRVAFNEKDQQQYAVKILSKSKMKNYNLLLRRSRNPLEEAHREINILRRLDHPNIIQLIEVVDQPDDDNIYIVFELLDQTLLDLPTESPLSEGEARVYFREIVCGVEHLHQQRIVHRDLKPDNMLLSRKGVVKIADFGFCEEVVTSSEDEQSSQSESEEPAMMLEPEVSAVHGTPAFTPPECLLSQKKHVNGYALDMWSLGITLYSLVVGDVPFKGDNMPQLFRTIIHDPVVYPDDVQISASLKDLISRLLAKNPRKRARIDEVKSHPWFTEGLDCNDCGMDACRKCITPIPDELLKREPLIAEVKLHLPQPQRC